MAFFLFLRSRRRNLLKWSEQFQQAAAWATGSKVTVTADQADAPDGTHTADLLQPIHATDSLIYQIFGVTTGVVTGSVWLKSTGANRTFALQLSGGGFHGSRTITVTGQWQRFTVSGSVTGDATPVLSIGGGSTWTTGNDVYAWGAQVNPGPRAGAYLKTVGTAV